MFIQKKTVGPWEFNISDKSLTMGRSETSILEIYLRTWQYCFPGTYNFAEHHFGVKSSIVRFDYVVEHGRPLVYEIEERPAGLGVTCILRPDFMEQVKKYLREQEEASGAPFALFISEARKNSSDDALFTDMIGARLFEGEVDDRTLLEFAWYVRASRDEYDVDERFNSRSLSSIRYEGSKRYGARMGLWTEFGREWEPDWSEPFVVKPASGSRFEQVLLWHPKPGAGFATRTKVTTAIREGRVCYRQEFHAPEHVDVSGKNFSRIRRAYFIWSPLERTYACLGGIWVATPTARVHGTRDSICGPLLAP